MMKVSCQNIVLNAGSADIMIRCSSEASISGEISAVDTSEMEALEIFMVSVLTHIYNLYATAEE
jgi:hypothetical protein